MRNLRRKIQTPTLLAGAVIALSVVPQTTVGQTLDQQYRLYLDKTNSCSAMGFERDALNSAVLPGQASAALSDYCFRRVGPPPDSAVVTIGSTAPGANSAVSNAMAATDDAAVRRRRDAARNIDQQAQDNDLTLPITPQLSAFFSGDYQRREQNATQYIGGRTGDAYALTLGVDYRISTTGVVGLALRGERVSGENDADGDYESSAVGLALFGSWLPADGLFVDFSLLANDSTLESQHWVSLSRQVRHVISGIVSTAIDIPAAAVASDVDSIEWGGDIRSGYDFHHEGFTFGPRIAVRYRRADIEAYAEQGDTIMKLAFDAQTDESLQSIVGLQFGVALTMGDVVIVPQLNGEWLHEYRNDQRYVTARLVDDYRPVPSQFRFLNEAPDRDVFIGRLSVVALFKNGIGAFVTAEKMFDHAYRQQYGGSVGVRLEL
jgi:outer membrane autotransporter protein